VIDADIADACLEAGPTVDQRGVQRPQDGDSNGSTICDVGAVEVPEPGSALLSYGALLALALLAGFRRNA
jgi:hypothetical protein